MNSTDCNSLETMTLHELMNNKLSSYQLFWYWIFFLDQILYLFWMRCSFFIFHYLIMLLHFWYSFQDFIAMEIKLLVHLFMIKISFLWPEVDLNNSFINEAQTKKKSQWKAEEKVEFELKLSIILSLAQLSEQDSQRSETESQICFSNWSRNYKKLT